MPRGGAKFVPGGEGALLVEFVSGVQVLLSRVRELPHAPVRRRQRAGVIDRPRANPMAVRPDIPADALGFGRAGLP